MSDIDEFFEKRNLIPTRWVVVAECIEEDGELFLYTVLSDGLPYYVAHGMLSAQVEGYLPQPKWAKYR